MNEKFLLTIDGIFNIVGRGTLVTGEVIRGTIKQHDELEVVSPDKTLRTTCALLEKHRKIVTEAHEGEYIAVCLKGVSKQDLSSGMQLVIRA